MTLPVNNIFCYAEVYKWNNVIYFKNWVKEIDRKDSKKVLSVSQLFIAKVLIRFNAITLTSYSCAAWYMQYDCTNNSIYIQLVSFVILLHYSG